MARGSTAGLHQLDEALTPYSRTGAASSTMGVGSPWASMKHMRRVSQASSGHMHHDMHSVPDRTNGPACESL